MRSLSVTCDVTSGDQKEIRHISGAISDITSGCLEGKPLDQLVSFLTSLPPRSPRGGEAAN